MVTVLRPLSTSELLDRTFHLYRNNFLVFFGIVAVPQLFVLVLQLFGAALLAAHQTTTVVAIAVLTAIINFVAIEIAQGATVIAVSDLHLDRRASIATAYSTAKSSMLRVVGISLAIGIGVGVGCLFLLIPGIYLALAWSLSIPVTVLEGGGLNPSTTRSKELSRGARWRILVIYVLIIILTIVVGMIIDFPLTLAAAVLARSGTNGVALGQAIQAGGNFISTSLVGPLATIALTLVYYDQRVRKEGFDLQLMMANLQPSDSQIAQAAPAQ